MLGTPPVERGAAITSPLSWASARSLIRIPPEEPPSLVFLGRFAVGFLAGSVPFVLYRLFSLIYFQSIFEAFPSLLACLLYEGIPFG